MVEDEINKNILQHSIGIGSSFGNQLADIFAKKGASLPLSIVKDYKIPMRMNKGDSTTKLYQTVCQENEDGTITQIAHFSFSGEDISGDLPEGSVMSVKFEIDENMNMSGSIYLPYLDIEIDAFGFES